MTTTTTSDPLTAPLCLDALPAALQPAPEPWEFDYEAWLGLTDQTAPRRSVRAWCRWHGVTT